MFELLAILRGPYGHINTIKSDNMGYLDEKSNLTTDIIKYSVSWWCQIAHCRSVIEIFLFNYFYLFREFCQTRRMRSRSDGGSRTFRLLFGKAKPGLDSGELDSLQPASSPSSRPLNLCFSTSVVLRGVRAAPMQPKTKDAGGRAPPS